MFNEKQLEYIKEHLRVEEFFIKNKMFNWIKEEGKTTKPSPRNNERPLWNNNTTNCSNELVCTWPVGTEDSAYCNCKECDEDHIKKEEKFKIFKKEILELDTLDKIIPFINKYKPFLSVIFETRLLVIRHEVIMRKWNKAITPLRAINKFKSLDKNKRNDIPQLSTSH